jgi:hypothetical protein
MTLPAILIAAGAAICLVLGLIHLVYTFHGNKLEPHDAHLKAAMQKGTPRITRQTTMWKAWVGFNASHSLGAILFGWLYGYLAIAHPDFFFASPVLMATGLVFLLAFVVLGRLYWFSVPFRGVLLATALYVAGLTDWYF